MKPRAECAAVRGARKNSCWVEGTSTCTVIAYPEDTGVWFYVPLKVSTYYGSNPLGTLVVGTRCLKQYDKKRTYPIEGTYRWCVSVPYMVQLDVFQKHL